MLLIPKAFARVSDAASTDDTRPFITGVHVKETVESIQLEATDGKRLIRATLPKKDAISPDEYPLIPGLDASSNGATEGTIPADSWRKAFKAMPRRVHMPVLERLAVVLGETQVTLASTDLRSPSVSTSPLIEGSFPKTETVIPQGPPVFSILLDADLLADTLGALASFAEGVRSVRLEFYGPETPAKLTVPTAKEGAQVVAVLAPMRDGK